MIITKYDILVKKSIIEQEFIDRIKCIKCMSLVNEKNRTCCHVPTLPFLTISQKSHIAWVWNTITAVCAYRNTWQKQCWVHDHLCRFGTITQSIAIVFLPKLVPIGYYNKRPTMCVAVWVYYCNRYLLL